MNKKYAIHSQSWDESDEDSYKTLSKDEMDALRVLKPRSFATLNAWWIICIQVVFTLVIAFACFIFSELSERSVYTYSALVGGSIGFLPSALFLMRIEAAKRTNKTSPGSFLAAVVSGEFIKIFLTIVLFIGFALKLPDLKWIPLLVTYLVTLKCYLLAWFWK
jgi:ATP synthase protein I